jgi:hypothetical protein
MGVKEPKKGKLLLISTSTIMINHTLVFWLVGHNDWQMCDI